MKKHRNDDPLFETGDPSISSPSVPALPKKKQLDIGEKNDLLKYQMEKIEERYIQREQKLKVKGKATAAADEAY